MTLTDLGQYNMLPHRIFFYLGSDLVSEQLCSSSLRLRQVGQCLMKMLRSQKWSSSLVAKDHFQIIN